MKIPNTPECERMLAECQTPERVILHSRAVAAYARSLTKRLKAAGVNIDEDAVYAAGLLHDCKKAEPNHSRLGGDYLAEKGYEELAKIVAAHDRLPDVEGLDEAAVLFYADKRIRETENVTLEERFRWSLAKCKTEEAREAREKRLQTSYAIERLIADTLGVKDF